MLELGEVSQEEHQKIVDFLSSLKLDLVYLVGPHYLACKAPDQYRHFNQSADLALSLERQSLSGYLLLIKGSRGMKLETIRPEL